MASSVLNFVLLALTLAAGLAGWAAPSLIRQVVAPGFDVATQHLTVDLMRLMLASAILFGLSGIAMSILNSYQHFLTPALAPAIYNLSIIGGALLLAPRLGIHGLAWGVVIGSWLHLSIQIPQLLVQELHYRPALDWQHPGVREVARLMLPRIAGLATVQLNFLVNTILASRLAEGSLAALNYTWLLMLLPQGSVAQAVATAAFPTFSELAARQEYPALRRIFSASLRLIWYWTLPAAIGLILFGEPLVRLLLERGRFTPASTQAVVWSLQFYALGLLAHATVEILARAFYALHDTKTPVQIGAAAMLLNVLLSLLLMRSLAHGGLALANSLATSLEMVGLLWILRKRLGGPEARKLLRAAGQQGVSAAAMGTALIIFLGVTSSQAGLTQSVGGILLSAGVYFALSALLGSRELAMPRWKKGAA